MKVAAQSGVAGAAHSYNSQKEIKQQKVKDESEVEASSDGPAAVSSEKQKGVIRNLLDGHYKGVADVRLRINFYDEIAALEEGVRLSSMQNSLTDFRGSLDQAFSELVENSDLDEQQLQQIEELKKSLDLNLDELLGTELSAAELFGAVQNETKALSDTLESILEPVSNEVVSQSIRVEEPLQNSSEIQTESSINVLNDFKNKLTDAVAALESDGLSVSALPKPSEPSGNGTAYEKFLSVYQELQNGVDTIPDTEGQASFSAEV